MVTATPREKEIQEQFSSRAPIYDGSANWISDPGLLDTFVDMCRVDRNSTMLDVCTGTGRVGERFRGRVARIVGLDLTEKMLEHARARLDEVYVGRAESLPFAEGSFDLIVVRQALHFVETPLIVLREMHRCLRPGGQVIVGHRVPHNPEDAAWWERVNRKKQPLIKHLLQDVGLLSAIREAGFVDLQPRDYYLVESIQHWLDSPEARPGGEDVLALYGEAPPTSIEARQIEITDREIRDRWRWMVVSAWKPS